MQLAYKVSYKVSYDDSDDVRGRGPFFTIGFFANKADAESVNKPGRPKIYAQPEGMIVEELVIYDSLSEFDNATSKTSREAAFAKLTLEDRIALGLPLS